MLSQCSFDLAHCNVAVYAAELSVVTVDGSVPEFPVGIMSSDVACLCCGALCWEPNDPFGVGWSMLLMWSLLRCSVLAKLCTLDACCTVMCARRVLCDLESTLVCIVFNCLAD